MTNTDIIARTIIATLSDTLIDDLADNDTTIDDFIDAIIEIDHEYRFADFLNIDPTDDIDPLLDYIDSIRASIPHAAYRRALDARYFPRPF